MSEVTEIEVVKHITNSLNEMYAKGYADGLNAKTQLTIPKSIADELDKYRQLGFEEMGEADHWLQEHGITKWMCGPDYLKNSALFDIYLAGKALGVDLVRVTED